MRHSILFFIAVGLFGMHAGVNRATAAAAGGARPNIVMVLIDDMGYSDLACYGSNFYETPHIDRLASQGMRFTDAYAACPVCSPTRLSIMAGKYPARVGLTNYIAGDRWPDNSPLQRLNWQTFMPPEEVTVAEALKTSGYATACIGKWHLSPNNRANLQSNVPTQPAAQGFDFVVGNSPNRTDKHASALTDRAIEFIENNQERPFFLYLAHHSVHIPLEATPELVKKYTRRARPSDPQHNPTYAAMVECVDESVGRLVATLDELELADNTLVIFFSDNGGLNVTEGPNTPATSNRPLRDGKGFTSEGGIRVPLIVCWPSVVPSGQICSIPVSSVDFYPTFLEVSRTAAPPEQTLDGESLMPILKGSGSLQRDAIFWHYPHYSNQGGVPSGAIRQGDWKLIESYQDGSVELYNVVDDLGEQHDLAKEVPDKAVAMEKRLNEWLKSVGAMMPERNPDYNSSKPLYSNPKSAPQSWQASGKAVEPAESIK